MNKQPDHETKDSLFSGFKTNLTIAVVFGAVIFFTLLLHDLIVFGHTTQLVMYMVYGAGTFLGVLAATVLPTKVAPYAILLLVLVIAFFAYPGADSTSEPAQDLLENSQHRNLPVEELVTPPAAVVEPPLVQPEVTSVQPPDESAVVELPSPDAAVVVPESE